MLGAIIGDLAGSIYEYDQIKGAKPVKINNIIEKDAFYSDDTILTMAITDAILNNVDYETKLKEYAKKFGNTLPKHTPYFKTMFSPSFTKWANDNINGQSCGNGAMMRISPIGFLFNTEEEVIKQAKLATIPSHNSTEAIECAKIIALIIFYSKKGLSKQEIIKKMNISYKKPKLTTFNYTCSQTIDLCLYSFFNANSFEDCIKLAISFGGDTDTNACIVASMAEAFYGIGENLKKQALAKLPKEFVELIQRAYKVNYDRQNNLRNI